VEISTLGLGGSGELEKALGVLLEQLDALFVEEEGGVVCTKCAWDEYDFQIALALCKKSAYQRWQAKAEEQEKRSHEAWLQEDLERKREEERMNNEAAYLP
jgi:hypothetical protein